MQTVTGFLLSRQWRDTPTGLLLRFWLHTANGPLLIEQEAQESVFFVEQCHLDKALSLTRTLCHRTRSLPLKSFSQQNVTAFYFTSQHNHRRAASTLLENEIIALESDIRTVDRYLMERFITANISVSTRTLTQHETHQSAQNCKLSPIQFEPSFKVVSFDIETNINTNKLLSIGVYCEDHEIVFMVGDSRTEDSLPGVQFCSNERALLTTFIAWIHAYDPDILIGWNCINFDLRMIDQACKRLGLPFDIGRNKERVEWRTSPNNEDRLFILIPGRAVLDGIDTLKSATYSFESFSLESVSREVLGKGKLIHNPDDRGEEIIRLFHDDKPAFAKYNLEDCKLVWDIFEHTDLFQFAISRANLTGLPINKIGGSVAAFENQYLPRLHRQGYVAPNLPQDPEGVGSPGGYVMDSMPGLYNDVLVLDYKSLYPSIIRSFLIDPYGLTEAGRNNPEELNQISLFSKGYRGAYFKKENSILPGLIENLWQARDRAKANKQLALSQAIKIIMNSFYGVMGTPGCRFFDARLPSSITLRGHSIMNKTRELIEDEGYQVIYGDTDSIFVWTKKDLSLDEANKIGTYLAKHITQWWKDHLEQEYQLVSALELEFECHFTRFVMPTIRGSDQGSKKRYAGLITDENFTFEQAEDENFKLVFKGLETVRTDWTHLAREFQRELYQRIFLNKPYKDYIRQIVSELKSGHHDEKLVYRKRLRRKLDDYQKNVPPHVQAARMADENNVREGKPSRYQKGGWIRYFYTTNGPEPAENLINPLDYELYVERQIAPIVDGITNFLGTSFEEIISGQMSLSI